MPREKKEGRYTGRYNRTVVLNESEMKIWNNIAPRKCSMLIRAALMLAGQFQNPTDAIPWLIKKAREIKP